MRKQYHELLAGANVGAYASLDEGVNATVLEMLAWGIVLALPRKPWVEKLFWPQTYPFLFEKLGDLPSLLDWMLDHEEEARAQLTAIRAQVQEHHGEDAWRAGWDRLFDAIDERNARNKLSPIRRFREDAEQLMKARPEIPFATVLDASRATKVRPNERRAFSNYAAYLAVSEWDDHSQASPLLVR